MNAKVFALLHSVAATLDAKGVDKAFEVKDASALKVGDYLNAGNEILTVSSISNNVVSVKREAFKSVASAHAFEEKFDLYRKPTARAGQIKDGTPYAADDSDISLEDSSADATKLGETFATGSIILVANPGGNADLDQLFNVTGIADESPDKVQVSFDADIPSVDANNNTEEIAGLADIFVLEKFLAADEALVVIAEDFYQDDALKFSTGDGNSALVAGNFLLINDSEIQEIKAVTDNGATADLSDKLVEVVNRDLTTALGHHEDSVFEVLKKFEPTQKVESNVGSVIGDEEIVFTGGVSPEPKAGDYISYSTEFMKVVKYVSSTSTLTVERGAFGTALVAVPKDAEIELYSNLGSGNKKTMCPRFANCAPGVNGATCALSCGSSQVAVNGGDAGSITCVKGIWGGASPASCRSLGSCAATSLCPATTENDSCIPSCPANQELVGAAPEGVLCGESGFASQPSCRQLIFQYEVAASSFKALSCEVAEGEDTVEAQIEKIVKEVQEKIEAQYAGAGESVAEDEEASFVVKVEATDNICAKVAADEESEAVEVAEAAEVVETGRRLQEAEVVSADAPEATEEAVSEEAEKVDSEAEAEDAPEPTVTLKITLESENPTDFVDVDEKIAAANAALTIASGEENEFTFEPAAAVASSVFQAPIKRVLRVNLSDNMSDFLAAQVIPVITASNVDDALTRLHDSQYSSQELVHSLFEVKDAVVEGDVDGSNAEVEACTKDTARSDCGRKNHSLLFEVSATFVKNVLPQTAEARVSSIFANVEFIRGVIANADSVSNLQRLLINNVEEVTESTSSSSLFSIGREKAGESVSSTSRLSFLSALFAAFL